METISIRVENPEELDQFRRITKEKRSEIVRDIINEGKKIKAIKLYKEQKISLGLAAKFAGLCFSDFLDLLEEHNIEFNMTLDDAKKAMQNARELL